MPQKVASTTAFYPPRANWFSLIRYQYRTLRAYRLVEGKWVSKLGKVHSAIALIVPGAVFLPFQPIRSACFFLSWIASLFLYLAFLGSTQSTLATFAMSGIQGACVTAVLRNRFEEFKDGQRPVLCACFATAVTLVSLHLLEVNLIPHYVVLVNTPAPVLINPRNAGPNFGRLEWVAYGMRSAHGALGFDQILGLPGDVVEFYPDHFNANDVPYRNLKREMPSSGRMSVPANSLLIWPNSADGGGGPDWVLQRAAIVPMGSVIGVAYRRWFFRSQRFAPSVICLQNFGAYASASALTIRRDEGL